MVKLNKSSSPIPQIGIQHSNKLRVCEFFGNLKKVRYDDYSVTRSTKTPFSIKIQAGCFEKNY